MAVVPSTSVIAVNQKLFFALHRRLQDGRELVSSRSSGGGRGGARGPDKKAMGGFGIVDASADEEVG